MVDKRIVDSTTGRRAHEASEARGRADAADGDGHRCNDEKMDLETAFGSGH